MERIEWVDYGKSIGIYLVVLAHTTLFTPLEVGIYTFHMPLFFFISGYLFSFKQNPLYSNFVKKRFKQLIIPYLWINIITYLFWLFVGRRFGNDAVENILWYTPLFNALLGNASQIVHDVPIWFFVCLFVIENLFYLSFKKISNLWGGLLLFIIIGYVYYTFNPYLLPYSFNTAIIGIIFYIVGYLVRSKNILKKFDVLHLIIALIFLILISQLNGKVAMHKNFYNNYFLFLLGALAGITFVVNICLFLSSYLKERRLIQYIAKNTIIICGFHLLTFTFIKGIMVYILGVSVDILEQKILLNILFSIISVLLCFPIINIINRYFPFIVGRKLSR